MTQPHAYYDNCYMRQDRTYITILVSFLILNSLSCHSMQTFDNNERVESNDSRNESKIVGNVERLTPTNTILPLRLPQPRPIGDSNNHNRTNKHTNINSRQRKPNTTTSQNKLSTNCLAKREDIIRKRKQPRRNSGSNTQELKPKLSTEFIEKNVTQTDGWLFENEHEPNCTESGQYEPVQCSMGFCWCVNKYGQAIKNSATNDPELRCDPVLYDSQAGANHVMRGLSSEAADMLQAPTRNSLNTSSSLNDSTRGTGDPSVDPLLSLIPNNCGLSRERAEERAAKNSVENVWIPDCDPSDRRFYDIKQCHKKKVCWCVNECTGLPLETKDQLSKDLSINCSEIIKNIDSSCKEPYVKYLGLSKHCDDQKRFEIVHSLLGQFKTRLSSQMRTEKMSEKQIFEAMFATLDANKDGLVADREWFHFKENYKVVDRLDPDSTNQQHLSYSYKPDWSKIPISISKYQRRCWRDLLDYCSDNDILEFEVSINLTKWLDCTRLPPLSQRHLYMGLNRIPHAYSYEAALYRRNSTNPMLNFKIE